MNALIEKLSWEHDQYECLWEETTDKFGLTHGSCWYYGGSASGNHPYPIVRRADGMVAFPPCDRDNPFNHSEWCEKLLKSTKTFSWVNDRVLIWDQELDTDSKGNFVVVGDKCHYCGAWQEWNHVNYREADGCCNCCGAQ